MKIFVTPEQFTAIRKLSDECVRNPVRPYDEVTPYSPDFDEQKFIDGINEILGEPLVDRMKYKSVELFVREWNR